MKLSMAAMLKTFSLVMVVWTSVTVGHPCVSDSDDSSFVPPVDQFVPLAPQCCQYLAELSDSLSNFVACTVWNAKPFRVCQMCFEAYQNVTLASDALYADTTNYNGSTCVDQLLSSDKQAVIYQIMQEAQHIWTSSQCDKCYQQGGGNPPNISNDTEHFIHLNKLVFNCFALEEKQGGNVCKQCKQLYRNLNTFYASLGATSSDICMDIVESMNITRQAWSSTFNCLVQYEDTWAVAFTMACICLLPVLLYSGTAILENKFQNEVLRRKPNNGMYEEIGGESGGSSSLNQAYTPSSYDDPDSAFSDTTEHIPRRAGSASASVTRERIPSLQRSQRGSTGGGMTVTATAASANDNSYNSASLNTRSLMDINEQGSINA